MEKIVLRLLVLHNVLCLAKSVILTETGKQDSICELKPESGPCNQYTVRFFFDSDSGNCRAFAFGGCKANGNNFVSLEECKQTCGNQPETDSYMPSNDKLSNLYIPNDSPQKLCDSSMFAGCGDSTHNLQGSGAEINQESDSQNDELDEIAYCYLPPDRGTCNNPVLRYYYNALSNSCDEFVHGGCGGNPNNFKSLQHCKSKCLNAVLKKHDEVDVCSLPPEKGPCFALQPRFYYNKKNKMCQLFIYGGCGGNHNRFKTLSDCINMCNISKSINYTEVCSLPPESGKCLAYMPKYFYNSTSQQCEIFVYGGCGGNYNKFDSQTECMDHCSNLKPINYANACSLQPEAGNCIGKFEKYFYNSTSQKCENFTYSGCGGNDNRFETLEDCDQNCIAPKPIDYAKACLLSPEKGDCRAELPRYFYNSTSQQCEIFVYGGCGGNPNRFRSSEKCQQMCVLPLISLISGVCSLLPEKGPCKANISKYFYNSTSGTCEKFSYGGCEGNGNNFENLEECEGYCSTSTNNTDTDICSLLPEKGPCKGNISKYFYNSTSGMCEIFTYGGCGGNGNNFENMKECQVECSASPLSRTGLCSLLPNTGPCHASIRRYFYNSTSEKCETFTYGGCFGNSNNFKTRGDCEEKCNYNRSDICSQYPERGPCLANMKKYFYNTNSKKCEQFTYGGCGGNMNKFDTLEECEAECATNRLEKLDICSLLPDGGVGRAYLRKFYFNPQTHKCELFIYRGAKGNANNFGTVQECNGVCRPGMVQPDFCFAEPADGPCKAGYSRYYYDPTTNMCHKFIYGGCYGNQNNFCNKNDCMDVCVYGRNLTFTGNFVGINNSAEPLNVCDSKTGPNDVCKLPAESGPCKAAFNRFFYNKATQSCERFSYGGCAGNQNNFLTRLDCEDMCA